NKIYFEMQKQIVRKVFRKSTKPRIGVFGVGFYKYWPQFDGLLDDLMKKQEVFIGKLSKQDVEVIDFGMVDNVTSAYALVPKLKAENLDLIFCDMLTYATSNIFGIVVKSLDVPIVLVALQPDKA